MNNILNLKRILTLSVVLLALLLSAQNTYAQETQQSDNPKRSLHVSYYMGGCAAHVLYSCVNADGTIKHTGSMIDCTDGFACCKRSREYCIDENGKWKITIENSSSGAAVLCNPSNTTLPPLPPEAIIYFMKDCSPTCEQ